MNKDALFVVCEQTTPIDSKIEITHEGKDTSGNLRYLRYRQCLQSFTGKYNRNGRRWVSKYMKMMLQHPWVAMEFAKGGLAGESGHPMWAGGTLSIDRLCQIDPDRVCLYVKDWEFTNNDTLLFGTIETAMDDGGSGSKFMYSILQGITPAVSARTLIPQKKNPDGTIEQTGPGRLYSYDRVFFQSHEEAMRDMSTKIKYVNKPLSSIDMVPVTESAKPFEMAYENIDFTNWVYNKSDSIKFVLDGMHPAMEAAIMDINGTFSVPTENGMVIIPTSNDKIIRNAIKEYYKQ